MDTETTLECHCCRARTANPEWDPRRHCIGLRAKGAPIPLPDNVSVYKDNLCICCYPAVLGKPAPCPWPLVRILGRYVSLSGCRYCGIPKG